MTNRNVKALTSQSHHPRGAEAPGAQNATNVTFSFRHFWNAPPQPSAPISGLTRGHPSRRQTRLQSCETAAVLKPAGQGKNVKVGRKRGWKRELPRAAPPENPPHYLPVRDASSALTRLSEQHPFPDITRVEGMAPKCTHAHAHTQTQARTSALSFHSAYILLPMIQ